VKVVLSVVARILTNVEAFNMAETIGNVSRHRRAPVVISENGGYRVVYVTAVSGESLNYHYSRLLTEIAAKRNLPLTDMDKRGFYMKFSDNNIIKSYYNEVIDVIKEKSQEDPCKIEEVFVNKSIVADVTGFLYTDKQIRRVSRIRFAYMIPTLDSIVNGATASYPELHVRYTPRAERKEQALYYVEVGSTLYSFAAQLNASDIYVLDYCQQSDGQSGHEEKKKRVEAAIDALASLLDGVLFGAKRSRFMPQWSIKSMLVVVSKAPIEFNPQPALDRKYISKTYERAVALTNILNGNRKENNEKSSNGKSEISLYAYIDEDVEKPIQVSTNSVNYKEVSVHTEAFKEAKDKVIGYLFGEKADS